MLERRLQTEVPSLQKKDFQEFVEFLFTEKYDEDFRKIKPYNDDGNDGVIEDEKIIACYGPEGTNKRKFENKAKDDFDKFLENLYPEHKEWIFVINDEVLEARRKFVKSLPEEEDIETKIWGLNRLLKDIRDLKYTSQCRIAKKLGIDENYIDIDIFDDIVKDIRKEEAEIEEEERNYPDLEEKFRENFSEQDYEAVQKNYYELIGPIETFRKNQKEYSGEIKELRSKVLSQYTKFDGEFDERFDKLHSHFCQGHEKDDIYCNRVKAVLFYFFETCLIGNKPRAET